MNLYLEIVAGQDGKAPGAFYQTPGLTLFSTCGNGPINGMQPFADGTLHVFSNNSAYIVDATGTATANGTLGSAPVTTPVSIITSAGEGSAGPTQTHQIAVFTGAAGFYSSGSGYSAISLPSELTKPITAASLDTFGLVNQQGTNIWWQSDALDLSTWDSINFTFADALPSNVVAIKMFERQLWVMKDDSTEFWVDQGTAGFAFSRLDGPFSHTGLAAQWSPAMVGESLMWVTRTVNGQAQVVRASSYQPVRISTHAIERELQKYPRIDDAIGYGYQQQGHDFYVITFPSANVTWCFDATASAAAGVPIWHQRGLLNRQTGQFDRHPGVCYAFYNGKHLIGDYRSGNIYTLDLDATTDGGERRKWLRTWRALQEPTMKPRRFSSLQIDMQTGVGVPASDNPMCSLRWSDDGGHKWSSPRTAAVGPAGDTAARVKFNRLGSTRRNSGLDRIFELSSSDVFSVGLMGAELDP